MKVNVTRKHIDDGKREQATNCPIALAVKGMGHEIVHVGNTHVTIKDVGIYYLSERAKKFIHRFDRGKSVDPATFIFKEKASG